MILACCDIGNTRIKIGIFSDNIFEHFKSFNTVREVTRFLRTSKPDAVAISSVVPKKSSVLIDFCHSAFGIEPFIIDNKKRFRLKIDYTTPSTLGIDRICTSEAAFKLYSDKKPLQKNEVILVADLGTASTFNLISYPDIFSGGLIAPGPGLLFKAMKLYTAQLPDASKDDYTGLIGKDTKSCIVSGIMNSVSGLIERIHKDLSKEKKIVKIYMTGGNAPEYIGQLDIEIEYKPELLILGMKVIYDYNTSN